MLFAVASQDDEIGRRFGGAPRAGHRCRMSALRLRPLAAGRAMSVESARILLDDAVARAAFDAAGEAGRPASGVLAYLANAIRARGREIPYSVIAAADLGTGRAARRPAGGGLRHAAAGGDAQRVDLAQRVGLARSRRVRSATPIDIDYYRWEDAAGLVTRTARFSLAGVVAIGGDVDATLAPDVPGVTGAEACGTGTRPSRWTSAGSARQDEDYWERYRATPKAFVTLAAGQALWQSRFGRLTAVRVALPEPTLAATLAQPHRSRDGRVHGRRRPARAGSTPRAARSTWASTSCTSAPS